MEEPLLKRNGFIGGAVLLFLLCAILVTAALPASASGVNVDLSRPASAHNKELNAADIVEYFVGEGISNEEREYLEKHGGVSIFADFGVTTAYVVTEYRDGTLSVRAREYSYTDKNGTTVVWIPTTVVIGNDEYELTMADDDYRADITRDLSPDASCTVNFTLSLLIPVREVNRVLNLAYNDIPAVRREVERGYAEYDRLFAEYTAGSIAYEDYLLALSVYEADLAAYTDYLSRKKVYLEKKAEYDAYLLALDEYNTAVEREGEYRLALEKYNADLLAYNEYVSALDIYRDRLSDYLEYEQSIALVREQLAALDAFFLPMTDGRTAAGAINGGLVTTILEENRDLFEGNTFKIPACLIDDAAYATRNLRLLLADYATAVTEEEKYQFYINSYEAVRDNTVLLLQSLDELYNNDKVRTGIQAKDQSYPRKYEILVSQLVIIANSLTDGEVKSYWAVYHDTKCTADCTLSGHKNNRYVFTEATKIHKTSVKDMLEGKSYLTDTENAAPLSGGVPQTVERPTEPVKVEKPIKPTAPTVPAKPNEVQSPGEPPTEIGQPTEPTKVEMPVKPAEYIPPPEYLGILSLYDAGGLSEREEMSGECLFRASATVTKSIFNVTTVTVFFYSEEGELLYATSVDSGTRADFVGDLPEKGEDASATYTFSHWSDAAGNAADLGAVTSDLALYPSFDVHTKSYNVTFNVDGKKTTVSTLYGSVPVFDGVPTRPDDEYREYSFSGWSGGLSPVTGDAEYTAEFVGKYILPLGIGGARLEFSDEYITAECRDPFSTSFDLSGVMERATEKGSGRGIILDTGLFDITISYGTILEMLDAGDTTVTLNRTKRGDYAQSFTVAVGDGEYRIAAKLPCSLSEGRQLRFYYLSDGEKNATAYTLADGIVSATLSSGVTYHLSEEYELSFIENPLVTLSVATGTVSRGSRVSVSATVENGIRLDRVYLVYPDGSEVDVDGFEFIMPDSDVTVCTTASRIEYRITFVSADKTISVRTYYYGDEPVFPPAPTRPNDGEYRYYFVGWSEKSAPVTSDKTYYALYEKVPLPPALDDSDDLRISHSVLVLIVCLVCGCIILFLAVIPAGITATVISWRESKRFGKRRRDRNG